MRRIAPLAALALTACLAACGSTTSNSSSDASSAPAASVTSAAPSSAASSSSGSAAAGSYTMAEVQKHNNDTDCWTAIDGNVYDVTSWISQHPGGPERIKSLCGQDGTAMFHGQHGDQGEPNDRLATFKVGTLAG